MDTTQLDRITHEDSMQRLLYWKDKYNITIQIYLGDYNIYIDKPKLEGGEVSLYNKGGYETIWQAINEAVNWLEEKNPVRDGQNLIMGQPVKTQSENIKLPIPHVSGSLPDLSDCMNKAFELAHKTEEVEEIGGEVLHIYENDIAKLVDYCRGKGNDC